MRHLTYDPRALRTGRLSHDTTAPNYAGHYMFMGFRPDGTAAFKNRNSREYIR